MQVREMEKKKKKKKMFLVFLIIGFELGVANSRKRELDICYQQYMC